MTAASRNKILKGVTLALWLSLIVCVTWILWSSRFQAHELPRLLRHEVVRSGFLGPLLIVGAYLASIGVPFPTMSLATLSGSVYGPLAGGLLAIVGFNLSTCFGFWLGRFLGRNFIDKHERGWVMTYNQKLCKSGFVTVLLMRLVSIPSDVVSFGCGMTKMPFRQFAAGTFFGSLPMIITFDVLGSALMRRGAWRLFVALLIVCVACALYVRYSEWGTKALAPRECAKDKT